MSEEVSAGLPVDRLIDALREHAAVMTAEAEPQVAMRAIMELRAAALSYANAVFDASGWGNVFNDLESDEDDDDEDDDEFVVEDGVERLSLTGRWDFLVRDAEALQRLASERLRATHPNSDDDDIAEHSDTPAAALEQLVSMDVGTYPGLETAGGGWTIESVERTLFEMRCV